MSQDREAVRLNLEYYRKAAKSLLKASQAGDPAAVARIARFSAAPTALSVRPAGAAPGPTDLRKRTGLRELAAIPDVPGQVSIHRRWRVGSRSDGNGRDSCETH